MVHIPLWTPELLASMAAGGRPIDDAVCGNPASESQAPDESTAAFMEVVRGAEGALACVLCGHIHSSRAHRIRYDTPQLLSGGSRAGLSEPNGAVCMHSTSLTLTTYS